MAFALTVLALLFLAVAAANLAFALADPRMRKTTSVSLASLPLGISILLLTAALRLSAVAAVILPVVALSGTALTIVSLRRETRARLRRTIGLNLIMWLLLDVALFWLWSMLLVRH